MKRYLILAVACCLIVASVEAQYSMGPGKKKRGGGGVSSAPVTNETWAPNINITSPSTGPWSGLNVTIDANASDTGSGVASVSFYWLYCPAGVCGAEQLIGTDTTAPYSVLWTFPACGPYPEDRFAIQARAVDVVGNVSANAREDGRLTGRGC